MRPTRSLAALERERLQVEVKQQAKAWTLGAASVNEIDRLNIRRATILAMQRALNELGPTEHHRKTFSPVAQGRLL